MIYPDLKVVLHHHHEKDEKDKHNTKSVHTQTGITQLPSKLGDLQE